MSENEYDQTFADAREFVEVTVTEVDGVQKVYENGEFWFAADMLFISHAPVQEPHNTRRLKIYNTRYLKTVSLVHGV